MTASASTREGRLSRAAQRAQEARGEQPGARLAQQTLWLALAALWALLTAALLSFDPLDPPSHAAAQLHETPSNWVGRVGAHAAYWLIVTLGPGVWLFIAAWLAALVHTLRGRRLEQPLLKLAGLTMLAVATSAFVAIFLPSASALPEGAGGLLGVWTAEQLTSRFGLFGAAVWLTLAAAVGALVAADAALRQGLRSGAALTSGALQLLSRRRPSLRIMRRSIRANDVDDDERPRTLLRAPHNETADMPRVQARAKAEEPEDASTAAAEAGAPQVFDPDRLRARIAKLPVRFAGAGAKAATEEDIAEWRLADDAALEGYRFPGLDLLEEPEANYSKRLERFVREQARTLEEALRTYRIQGQVVGAESGPVITLYEVRLAPGTKVSQLSSVAQDIARALKAVNVRIVPSMQGRDTVGIEVPNASREKVRLKELMASAKGRAASAQMKLPMFLGKDVSGAPLIEDLAAMPHLLIAGATGAGKSVCMNSIIMSFLYTRKPNELKLVLIDPKMVEMSQFRDIPHLMCPVVTEMGKAAAILEWAVHKMDERYALLAEAGVRDIASYNALSWEELRERLGVESDEEAARIPRRLPYIVFVIDELADLIMTHKEVEGFIVRVAQKARAVGMHLVIATQRPQANVVTGLIKSNMPGRICFKVASGMDSRIVLDQKGGELLLGQGDMLFLSARSHKLTRAQGALVEDHEARRVVRFLREVAAPSYERQLVQLRGAASEEERDGLAAAQEDPLFDKAVEIVLETKRGSVSLLQRRLAIGYTRASRLIDLMGEAGIIGGYKGTVAREVLMSREEWEAVKAQARADAASAGGQAALHAAGEVGNLSTPATEAQTTAADREALTMNTAALSEEPVVASVSTDAVNAPTALIDEDEGDLDFDDFIDDDEEDEEDEDWEDEDLEDDEDDEDDDEEEDWDDEEEEDDEEDDEEDWDDEEEWEEDDEEEADYEAEEEEEWDED